MSVSIVRQAETVIDWEDSKARTKGFRDGYVDEWLRVQDMLDPDTGEKVTLQAFVTQHGLVLNTFRHWRRQRGVTESRFSNKDRHTEASNIDASSDGWDLPGVAPEISQQWRENIKRNERLLEENCLHCPYHCRGGD